MDWTAIIITALTSSGLTGFLGWRIRKKQGEIETVKKLVDEIYKPALEFQEGQIKKQQSQIERQAEQINEQNKRIDAQEKEIAELRARIEDCADSRDECHKMLATLKDEIARLQRSRDNRGRYAKEFRPVTKEVKDAVDA